MEGADPACLRFTGHMSYYDQRAPCHSSAQSTARCAVLHTTTRAPATPFTTRSWICRWPSWAKAGGKGLLARTVFTSRFVALCLFGSLPVLMRGCLVQ